MTSCSVVDTEHFHEELHTQLAWFALQVVPAARTADWLSELLQLVDSFGDFPQRHAVAEPKSAARSIEIRCVVSGDYLVFDVFDVIDEDRLEAQLLGFRHGARKRP